MPPPTPAAPYRSWLLRCWHERGAAGLAGGWRFSLEEPGTGERRGFGSLEALLAFLERALAGAGPDAGGAGPPGEPLPRGPRAPP
jgi:hypothetical protein